LLGVWALIVSKGGRRTTSKGVCSEVRIRKVDQTENRAITPRKSDFRDS